jgi:hypothetical protein
LFWRRSSSRFKVRYMLLIVDICLSPKDKLLLNAI